jgi:hypothetical protein
LLKIYKQYRAELRSRSSADPLTPAERDYITLRSQGNNAKKVWELLVRNCRFTERNAQDWFEYPLLEVIQGSALRGKPLKSELGCVPNLDHWTPFTKYTQFQRELLPRRKYPLGAYYPLLPKQYEAYCALVAAAELRSGKYIIESPGIVINTAQGKSKIDNFSAHLVNFFIKNNLLIEIGFTSSGFAATKEYELVLIPVIRQEKRRKREKRLARHKAKHRHL